MAEFGSWGDGVWSQRLSWRRRLFVWEEALVHELLILLQLMTLKSDEDCWSWLRDAFVIYSVRLAYTGLMVDSS